jgi:hypothetical protein
MALVELSDEQLNCVIRALETYSTHLQEYEEDPSAHLEELEATNHLADKLRALLPR